MCTTRLSRHVCCTSQPRTLLDMKSKRLSRDAQFQYIRGRYLVILLSWSDAQKVVPDVRCRGNRSKVRECEQMTARLSRLGVLVATRANDTPFSLTIIEPNGSFGGIEQAKNASQAVNVAGSVTTLASAPWHFQRCGSKISSHVDPRDPIVVSRAWHEARGPRVILLNSVHRASAPRTSVCHRTFFSPPTGSASALHYVSRL